MHDGDDRQDGQARGREGYTFCTPAGRPGERVRLPTGSRRSPHLEAVVHGAALLRLGEHRARVGRMPSGVGVLLEPCQEFFVCLYFRSWVHLASCDRVSIMQLDGHYDRVPRIVHNGSAASILRVNLSCLNKVWASVVVELDDKRKSAALSPISASK